jgi:hypothetical protein
VLNTQRHPVHTNRGRLPFRISENSSSSKRPGSRIAGECRSPLGSSAMAPRMSGLEFIFFWLNAMKLICHRSWGLPPWNKSWLYAAAPAHGSGSIIPWDLPRTARGSFLAPSHIARELLGQRLAEANPTVATKIGLGSKSGCFGTPKNRPLDLLRLITSRAVVEGHRNYTIAIGNGD